MLKRRVSAIATILIAAILCVTFAACTSPAGKSAYEIAVDNGFSGTEQEWLRSLSGQDGADGQNAQNIDVYELFELYCSQNSDATFADFLGSLSLSSPLATEYAVTVGIQSAVSIYSTFTGRGVRPGQTADYMAGGAGVVYRIQGGMAYIITNYHVIYDRDSQTTNGIAKTIEVYAYGHETIEETITAEFVGGSITKDIAVIQAAVADFPDGIKAAKVADSNQVTLGEQVVAIGNPLGESIAVTSGIISVDSEEIEMEALDSAAKTSLMRVLRTDTAINSGNSGGGLFNLNGQLIGIVNAKTVQSGVESMGYAIPAAVAVGIADAVIDNSSKKCVLGITVFAASTKTVFDTEKGKVRIVESIVVDSVNDDALATGRLQNGDKLVSVRIGDGEETEITRVFQLSDYLYKVRVGDTVHLTIERESETMTIALTPESANFTTV